jgi:lipopolysaccharide export system protein LptC
MAALEQDDGLSGGRTGRPGSRTREEQFATAQGHSRRVRRLKVVLPLLGVALGVGFFAYSFMSAPFSIDLDMTGAVISDGKLVMTEPKLDGFTKDDLPYSMSAARALQNLDATGLIELQGMKARLPVEDGKFASFAAERGHYDRDKNTLDISSPIAVSTTDGMAASLKSAFVDLGKGDLRTTEPVDITLKGAKITADSMTILENGKLLLFERRVRLRIEPERLGPLKQANGDVNAAN